MRHTHAAVLALIVFGLAARPGVAAAQKLLPALVGGAAGLAAGAYVSIGIVTLQARRGDYIYSTEEALGWYATPILVGPAVGFTIGLVDKDRLRRTIIGGAAGGALGTGVGALLGLELWDPPEGKWAGGVVGGAAGLLVGAAVGLLWPADSDDPADGAVAAGVPIGIRIRF